MFWHASREPHGIRWWWHLGDASRAVVHIELYWWSPRVGLTIGTDDEGWHLSMRVPPIAFYLSLEGFRLWQPRRKAIATWDGDREIWLPDRRELEVFMSDWTMRITPWGRWCEWCAADPWWIRGVSLDLKRLVLGRWDGGHIDVARVDVTIPMPEGTYHGVVTIQHWTRGRARWFKQHTTEAWLEIPKGIPHAGKGENSWDCGDDGLFGIGGASVEDVIRRAQESVMHDRQRYGKASDEAIREALA